MTEHINNLRANSSLVVNGTLPHEAYIKWDEQAVELFEKELVIMNDFISRGLVDRSFNLGDSLAKYETISDVTAASVAMTSTTGGELDNVMFGEDGVPLPMFFKNFRLTERQIQACQDKPGKQLEPIYVRRHMREVMSKFNDAIINGVQDLKYGGYSVYGLTNHPNRLTHTISNAWGGGSEDPIADVLAMKQALVNKSVRGPFAVYVSEDNDTYLEEDYSTQKSGTVRERIESISGIESVRVAPGLSSGEVVMVQLDPDTIDIAIAQDFTSIQQPQSRHLQYDFTAFGVMAPRIKKDYNNTVGICHATGA